LNRIICFSSEKKHADGYEQEQIYIEPKGSHLLEKDAWKEAFLLRIEQEGIPCKKYADDNQYRVIGLPFFNTDYECDFSREFRRRLMN
jgi:type III restriction enzyme